MGRLAAAKPPKKDDFLAPDGAKAATPRERLGAALDEVATYIPSEVVGIYLAAMGILAPASNREVLVVFLLGLLLAPAFTAAVFHLNEGKDKRKLTLVTTFAVAAYCAWAIALPDNFLAREWDRATLWGGIAVLVLAAGLPVAGKVARLED